MQSPNCLTNGHVMIVSECLHRLVTYSAGPGDYDVVKDMKWNRRLVHVKGKGTTRPYAVRGMF